jgi:hypothetical protein
MPLQEELVPGFPKPTNFDYTIQVEKERNALRERREFRQIRSVRKSICCSRAGTWPTSEPRSSCENPSASS